MAHLSPGLTNAETIIGRHRFFILFSYLLIALILYPYIKEGTFNYFVFRVLGSAGILLTLYAISLRRSLLLVALILAVPAILERWLLPRADASVTSILYIIFSFVFDVFVVVVIFRQVFTNQKPNSETVFGALCIYLLVGFSFASLYGMVAMLQPRAFYLDPVDEPAGDARSLRHFVYYSFATMTSLGANGITGSIRLRRARFPSSRPPSACSILPSLIARLISSLTRHPSTLSREDAP